MDNSPEITISWLKPLHTEPMIDLLAELFAYYNPNETISRDVVRKHFITNLAPLGSPSKLLIAQDAESTVIGFAAVTFLHSLVDPRPDRSKQCLLKELYVRNGYRRKGVGDRLMSEVIDHAKEAGCARIDWNVKTHNHAGVRFYERFGAKLVEDRASYRLEL